MCSPNTATHAQISSQYLEPRDDVILQYELYKGSNDRWRGRRGSRQKENEAPS